jgi:hypothetical protein
LAVGKQWAGEEDELAELKTVINDLEEILGLFDFKDHIWVLKQLGKLEIDFKGRSTKGGGAEGTVWSDGREGAESEGAKMVRWMVKMEWRIYWTCWWMLMVIRMTRRNLKREHQVLYSGMYFQFWN